MKNNLINTPFSNNQLYYPIIYDDIMLESSVLRCVCEIHDLSIFFE